MKNDSICEITDCENRTTHIVLWFNPRQIVAYCEEHRLHWSSVGSEIGQVTELQQEVLN